MFLDGGIRKQLRRIPRIFSSAQPHRKKRKQAKAVSMASAKKVSDECFKMSTALKTSDLGMELPSIPKTRKSQAQNCYILKLPTELLFQIESLLPESAKICLRHCSIRLLQLNTFPGWRSQEHLKAYEALRSFNRFITMQEEGEIISSLAGKFACSYCKEYHEQCWFSKEELLQSPRDRKCHGSDPTRSLRISHEVDMTWAEFKQYFDRVGHYVIKQADDSPDNLYSFKWSHMIYMHRSPEMETELLTRSVAHTFII